MGEFVSGAGEQQKIVRGRNFEKNMHGSVQKIANSTMLCLNCQNWVVGARRNVGKMPPPCPGGTATERNKQKILSLHVGV